MLTLSPAGPVLIAGGYGVVGSELTALLHAHRPDLAVIVAGRSRDRAAGLLARTGVGFVAWDVTAAPPPVAVRAVVGAVNDPDDVILRACLRGGVPLVDLTRWTSRLQRALAIAAAGPTTAGIMLSSGWAGGVVSRLAALVAEQAGPGARIETTVRYDLADRSGADSVEFIDRLDRSFEAGGRPVRPLGEPRLVRVGGQRLLAARIDTPEQFTLPALLDCGLVSTRLGFSSVLASGGLLIAQRVGLFRMLRGERWRGVRHRLLHSPGQGGLAVLTVRAQGPSGDVTATVNDPAGQAHLTAVGGMLSLFDVLSAPAGVHLPEMASTAGLDERLGAAGVRLTVTDAETSRAA